MRRPPLIADPESFRELVYGRTVAVVGNAPTANAFDHAERIDQCDVVIRFNRFRVGGDYANVGTKIDVFACPLGWNWTPRTDDVFAKAAPKLILAARYHPKSDAGKAQGRNAGRLSARHDIVFLPREHVHRIEKDLGCRPTSGLWVLVYLLNDCQPRSIYATGFSFQLTEAHHYYPDQSYCFELHDPRKELQYVARNWPTWSGVLSVDPHMTQMLAGGEPAPEYGWVYSQIAETVIGSTLEVGPGIGAKLFRDTGRVTHLAAAECVAIGELGPFDNVVCVEVAEHLAPIDVHPFLRELRSIGRRMFFSSPDRREGRGRRTPKEWTIELRHAGWKVTAERVSGSVALLVAE